MLLDKDKMVADEKFSNHAVQGFSYQDCPRPVKDVGCFGIATGFGGVPVVMCDCLNLETGECNYEATE